MLANEVVELLKVLKITREQAKRILANNPRYPKPILEHLKKVVYDGNLPSDNHPNKRECSGKGI